MVQQNLENSMVTSLIFAARGAQRLLVFGGTDFQAIVVFPEGLNARLLPPFPVSLFDSFDGALSHRSGSFNILSSITTTHQ